MVTLEELHKSGGGISLTSHLLVIKLRNLVSVEQKRKPFLK